MIRPHLSPFHVKDSAEADLPQGAGCLGYRQWQKLLLECCLSNCVSEACGSRAFVVQVLSGPVPDQRAESWVLTSSVTGTICRPCWWSTAGRLPMNSLTSITTHLGCGLLLSRPPARRVMVFWPTPGNAASASGCIREAPALLACTNCSKCQASM